MPEAENIFFNQSYHEAIKPQTIEGRPYAVVPEDFTFHDLTPALGQPPRIQTRPVFHRVEDFCQYVNQFKTPSNTQIFADITESRIAAVFDWPGDTGGLLWMDHWAHLHPLPDEQWGVWEKHDVEVDGKKFNQADFIEFLETNRFDIIDPSGADLMELCNNLETTKKSTFKSGVRNRSGEYELQCGEVHGDGPNKIKIPSRFMLSATPYRFSPPQDLAVRLFYRIDGPMLVYFNKRERPDTVKEQAFQAILDAIESQTEIAPKLGVGIFDNVELK